MRKFIISAAAAAGFTLLLAAPAGALPIVPVGGQTSSNQTIVQKVEQQIASTGPGVTKSAPLVCQTLKNGSNVTTFCVPA